MDFRYPRYPLYQTASWREYDANGIGVGKALVGTAQEAEPGVNLSLPLAWLDGDPTDPIGNIDVATQCADAAYQTYVYNHTVLCGTRGCQERNYDIYVDKCNQCFADENVDVPLGYPRPHLPYMP